jgi:hypothetical protein
VNEADCHRIEPDLRSFLNTNTEEEMRMAEAILAERAKAG